MLAAKIVASELAIVVGVYSGGCLGLDRRERVVMAGCCWSGLLQIAERDERESLREKGGERDGCCSCWGERQRELSLELMKMVGCNYVFVFLSLFFC